MMGSDSERMEGRHKINSMICLFGNPTLFLTFNPHHGHNESLKAACGIEGLDLTERIFGAVTADQERILAANPFLSARWFKNLMDNIIQNIFGWDIDRQESRVGGGLFGQVQAYMVAIEEQKRGTLLCHIEWVGRDQKSERRRRRPN